MAIMIYFQSKILGLICMVLCICIIVSFQFIEIQFRFRFRKYIEHITNRVKRAGSEVVQSLPIGLILYNDEFKVEWHNPHILKILNIDSIMNQTIFELIPSLNFEKMRNETFELTIGSNVYELTVNADENLIIVDEITNYKEMTVRYEDEKSVLGLLILDNIEEATQGLDDLTKNMILSKVTGIITEWGRKTDVFIKRISAEKFIVLCYYNTLRKLEQTRFEILDEVKEGTSDNKLPVTLSIGFASHFSNWIELGQMAQTSLDMSLGRGGDQVTVKVGQKLNFYGGKSNATEKRTRVRARVVAHALRDLILESDKILVMGHQIADVDSLGAAIGIWESSTTLNKDAFIILDEVNPSIERMIDYLNQDSKFNNIFINGQTANDLITYQSLIIIVDTHKYSMLVEPQLLKKTNRIVVIDHHRRSEDFINDATLVYLEPYASSASELVTELIQYFDDVKLSSVESTALLAGIIVDTKSFSLSTGARTFEAASFLRRNGADPNAIHMLLKDNLDSFIIKAEIIKNTRIIYEHIALIVTESDQKYSQMNIAQVADTLLNIANIKASFVISQREVGLVNISARSLGQMNVQLIMERLGGGGHLTNAATQLKCTIDEATKKLILLLQEIDEQEGLFS